MLLRIASCGPPGQHGTRRPVRRPRALPGRGRPRARPEDATGHPAERARRPHHQTTVAPIAPSDRPSGPKVRTGVRAAAGADPDGGHPQHVRGTGSTTRPPGRAGMGCWVRTAAGGAAVRTPSDRLGEAPPGTPGGRFPGGSACRQEQAGRQARHAPDGRTPEDARRPPRTPPGPGAPCSRPPAGCVLVLAFPGYDLTALAVLGPAALALAVRGQRFRSGLWLGLVIGPRLLRAAAVLDRHLRRPAARGWRWRCSRPLHLALLGGATALVSRLPLWPLWAAALWVADEALRGRFVLGGFPWGRLGFSQTEGPLLVAGRLRRRAAGHLRRRPHRHAAGRGRARAAPGPVGRGGDAAAALARRRPRRGRRPRRPARWGRWPGCRCPARR